MRLRANVPFVAAAGPRECLRIVAGLSAVR
jgi:hypothetical protein